MRSKIFIGLAIVFLSSAGIQSISLSSANAGPFDCVKAKKYSNYSKLRNSFMKDPKKKTEDDWFKAYTFATIFNGYPKCFKTQDVAVMRDFVKLIDGVCAKDPNWGYVCKIAPVKGAMTDWAYNGYK
jgi:hypothetical protein